METGFALEKKHAIRIAKDLCYGEKVIEKLQNAKNEREIARILATAREEKQ